MVREVLSGSIAEEMGIEAGDTVLAVNNNQIEDVFDYRYLMKDEYVEVLVRKADGEEWLLEIDKDYERIPFLQQQVYFLLYRSDAAGDAGNLVF